MRKRTEKIIQISDEIINQRTNIEGWNLSIENLRAIIKGLHSLLEELRDMVSNIELKEEDEIYFFKEIKPDILSKIMYFQNVYSIELNQPYGDVNSKRSYYSDQIQRLQIFFEKNIDFYQYYRSNSTNLDKLYFVRNHFDFNNLCLKCISYDRDPKFSTCFDHKIATIRSNDMLQIYLNNKIYSMNNQTTVEQAHTNLPSNLFKWTDTKSAAIELGYAIYAKGSINNGNADIKEIMSYLEAAFKVELGDYYRTYLSLKNRKKDRTVFLNSLIDNLVKKMDKGDQV